MRKLFYKSNTKLSSCVCIAWYKHSRGWENSRQLCKPEMKSRLCIIVSNSPNPSRVYIRLCKQGKRFLLLNPYTCSTSLKYTPRYEIIHLRIRKKCVNASKILSLRTFTLSLIFFRRGSLYAVFTCIGNVTHKTLS